MSRQRSLEELEQSYAKYRQLVEDSPAGIYEFDYISGKIVNVNDVVCEYTGYTRDEILSMSPLDLLTEESKPVALDRMKMVMAGERPPETKEYKIRCKDGSEIWSQGHIRYFYEGETLSRAIAVMHHVTDQRQIEAALRESEERFRTLVEQSPFGISLIDKDGRYKYLNPKFKEMFGYDLEDIPTGKEWFQKAYPDEEYRKEVISTWKEDQEALGIGEARPRTFRMACKNGEERVINFRTIKLENGGQLIFYQDMTETEMLEKQIRQAEKLEAIATLTSGIAHDYNNLLSIIVGNLGLALQDAEQGSDQAAFLNEAEKAARKVGELTHELMALSRGGAPIKEPGSLKELLRHLRNEILAESRISVYESISEDLRVVFHDPRKMRAVFRNVVQNAVEAMPDGGTLTLKAENMRVERGDAVPGLPLKPGDYVRISIKDEGRGISEEDLDKIFDPYFSTKAMGVQKGMGLGLATAYAIVQKHEGHITVNSAPGSGTTVSIYLPAAEKEASKKESKKSELTSGPKGKILVMDDEEMLRNVIQQMLTRLGYEIKTVKDGVEAIRAYRNGLDSQDPFDAVILDLTVKEGMGGEQTIQELVKIDPDIKAIASSGYLNAPVMADPEKYGFKTALAKPYEMKGLKETLENVL